MIEQLFEVATEFRFDVGQAVLNTQALQQAVDGVSSSASGAMRNLGFMAANLVTHMGLGSGGLLSILTKAVQVSQAFDTNVLSFSNIISTNTRFLAGDIDTFNDRLTTSRMLLDKVSDTAIQVGLPTAELARLTKLIASPLASHKKLGLDFEGAIDMSKNLLLGAQMTGLNPQAAGESLLRALTDKMPLQGKLFTRLAGTAPFQAAKITTQAQLQRMDPDKKIDLLAKSLRALGSDTEAVNYRLGRLDVQFTILRNQIERLILPIGDVLQKFFAKSIRMATDYLSAHGKNLGDSIGKFFANILDNPKALFINLMQIRALKEDFKKSLNIVELLGIFRLLKYGLTFLGVTFNGGLIAALFGGLISGITAIVAMVPWTTLFTGAMSLLGTLTAAVLPEFLALLFVFQTISRAKAIAKVNDIESWIKLTPKVSAMILKLKTAFENILLPINMAINFWAKLIAPLFETSLWARILVAAFEPLVDLFSELGQGVVYLMAGLTGLMDMTLGFVMDVLALRNPFANMTDNFKGGWDTFLKENQARLGGEGMNVVSNHVTNIGKLEARFDMREQLEPDRVAFAVTDHLKKLASNPTQGRGQGLGGPFMSGSIFNAALGVTR